MLRRFLPLALLLTCCAAFAGTVTGHVFLDANADGQWQAEESAVPRALLSDGLSFATSGDDGAYQLTSPDGEQVIFIDNPAGTWPTQGFYRNVKVGPAVADFPLRRQEQKLPFYFVQGTDLHIRPEIAPQMAQYVQALNSLPVPLAFVVHTGDLVVDATNQNVEGARKLFGAYQQMVAPLKYPLLNLPGNHEHTAVGRADVSADTPGFGKGLYREMFGPTYYAVNYAGVHFIALDGTNIAGHSLSYALTQPCLDWLKGYLEHVDRAEPLVLLTHEPIAPTAEKARVEPLLAGRKVLLTLSGHWHTIARYTLAGAPEIIGGMTSYPWHGGPFGPNPVGYHLVKITADGFEDGFGDWAQQYPVTVTAPERGATLKTKAMVTVGFGDPAEKPLPDPETIQKVQVQFLDPANEVTSAEVTLGPAKQTFQQFATQGLYRTLSCELAVPGIPEGFNDLVVTLHGKGEPTVEKQAFLFLGGLTYAFSPVAGPATLRFKAHGVNADDLIKLNGEEIGKLSAAAGAEQTVNLVLPAGNLRKLNVLELVSAPLADGSGCDDFSADYAELQYQDKTYRDYRLYAGAVQVPKSPTPVSATLYFDLTRPDL